MIKILSDQAVCDQCGLIYNLNYQGCPQCIRGEKPCITIKVKKHDTNEGVCIMCKVEDKLFARISKSQGGNVEEEFVCLRCYDAYNLTVR